MATDTSSSPGRGTRVRSIYVEQKLQRPALTDTLSLFFSELVLANGLRWDWCDKGCEIAVTVSFIEAVDFSMSVFGTAEV